MQRQACEHDQEGSNDASKHVEIIKAYLEEEGPTSSSAFNFTGIELIIGWKVVSDLTAGIRLLPSSITTLSTSTTTKHYVDFGIMLTSNAGTLNIVPTSISWRGFSKDDVIVQFDFHLAPVTSELKLPDDVEDPIYLSDEESLRWTLMDLTIGDRSLTVAPGPDSQLLVCNLEGVQHASSAWPHFTQACLPFDEGLLKLHHAPRLLKSASIESKKLENCMRASVLTDKVAIYLVNIETGLRLSKHMPHPSAESLTLYTVCEDDTHGTQCAVGIHAQGDTGGNYFLATVRVKLDEHGWLYKTEYLLPSVCSDHALSPATSNSPTSVEEAQLYYFCADERQNGDLLSSIVEESFAPIVDPDCLDHNGIGMVHGKVVHRQGMHPRASHSYEVFLSPQPGNNIIRRHTSYSGEDLLSAHGKNPYLPENVALTHMNWFHACNITTINGEMNFVEMKSNWFSQPLEEKPLETGELTRQTNSSSVTIKTSVQLLSAYPIEELYGLHDGKGEKLYEALSDTNKVPRGLSVNDDVVWNKHKPSYISFEGFEMTEHLEEPHIPRDALSSEAFGKICPDGYTGCIKKLEDLFTEYQRSPTGEDDRDHLNEVREEIEALLNVWPVTFHDELTQWLAIKAPLLCSGVGENNPLLAVLGSRRQDIVSWMVSIIFEDDPCVESDMDTMALLSHVYSFNVAQANRVVRWLQQTWTSLVTTRSGKHNIQQLSLGFARSSAPARNVFGSWLKETATECTFSLDCSEEVLSDLLATLSGVSAREAEVFVLDTIFASLPADVRVANVVALVRNLPATDRSIQLFRDIILGITKFKFSAISEELVIAESITRLLDLHVPLDSTLLEQLYLHCTCARQPTSLISCHLLSSKLLYPTLRARSLLEMPQGFLDSMHAKAEAVFSREYLAPTNRYMALGFGSIFNVLKQFKLPRIKINRKFGSDMVGARFKVDTENIVTLSETFNSMSASVNLQDAATLEGMSFGRSFNVLEGALDFQAEFQLWAIDPVPSSAWDECNIEDSFHPAAPNTLCEQCEECPRFGYCTDGGQLGGLSCSSACPDAVQNGVVVAVSPGQNIHSPVSGYITAKNGTSLRIDVSCAMSCRSCQNNRPYHVVLLGVVSNVPIGRFVRGGEHLGEAASDTLKYVMPKERDAISQSLLATSFSRCSASKSKLKQHTLLPNWKELLPPCPAELHADGQAMVPPPFMPYPKDGPWLQNYRGTLSDEGPFHFLEGQPSYGANIPAIASEFHLLLEFLFGERPLSAEERPLLKGNNFRKLCGYSQAEDVHSLVVVRSTANTLSRFGKQGVANPDRVALIAIGDRATLMFEIVFTMDELTSNVLFAETQVIDVTESFDLGAIHNSSIPISGPCREDEAMWTLKRVIALDHLYSTERILQLLTMHTTKLQSFGPRSCGLVLQEVLFQEFRVDVDLSSSTRCQMMIPSRFLPSSDAAALIVEDLFKSHQNLYGEEPSEEVTDSCKDWIARETEMKESESDPNIDAQCPCSLKWNGSSWKVAETHGEERITTWSDFEPWQDLDSRRYADGCIRSLPFDGNTQLLCCYQLSIHTWEMELITDEYNTGTVQRIPFVKETATTVGAVARLLADLQGWWECPLSTYSYHRAPSHGNCPSTTPRWKHSEKKLPISLRRDPALLFQFLSVDTQIRNFCGTAILPTESCHDGGR